MMFLIATACIIGYVFIGGLSAAKHNAITSAKCRYDDDQHWKGRWCGHCLVSLWAAGTFWPVGIPALMAFALGSSTKENRTDVRRTRELEEAKHQTALAIEKAKEAEALDRQLAAARK